MAHIMKHTKLPWERVEISSFGDRVAHLKIVGGEFRSLIVMMPGSSDLSYDNAEFIVRACNTHDELIGVVEAVIAERTNIGLKKPFWTPCLTELLKTTYVRAKEGLV